MLFCAHLHTQLENYRSYMDVLHIKWLLYYWRCLFSGLELYLRYSWWITAPNMHRSPFWYGIRVCLHAYNCNLKTTGCIGHSACLTTALLLETFLVWFRVAWEIWPESYSPRHAKVTLWYNIVCIFCKPIHTSPFGVQLCMTTKLT